ncbi:MAG: CHASE2 domain-containing protein [Microcoleaceae cyanobacterium]
MDNGAFHPQPHSVSASLTPSTTGSVFHLTIQQVGEVCLFELSWGGGQRLCARIPYPEVIPQLYTEWQQAYLSFYKNALRGRVDSVGRLRPVVDWHARLVQAEAKLLYEFHRWLRHEALFEIRAKIAKAAAPSATPITTPPPNALHSSATALVVDVFLTADPIDLARLPWEAWETATEFATTGKIRIVRKPLNIRGNNHSSRHRRRNRQMRVLAILGDERGLDFAEEIRAMQSLSSVAEVHFVGWQPGKRADDLRSEIAAALEDTQGWDVLFFAGHSNEAELVGGELVLGPQISMYLNQLIKSLTIAKERGLQFAIFNSCRGLDLANSLINLGLSQVAVMREPIHNQVAQAFLLHFLRSLSDYQDAHDALLSACRFLKLEKQVTYPSAYLIPSLFRHPDAPVFRLERTHWADNIRQWLPKKWEALTLAALLLVSWPLNVQEFLLDRRIYAQTLYREWTQQVPQDATPPLLMVGIDEEFIKRNRISDPKPFDREYLAKIVDQLTAAQVPVIGVDYLLDRHQESKDPVLAQAVQRSVQQDNTWFIFASKENLRTRCFADIRPEIADPQWSLHGDLTVLGGLPLYMISSPRMKEQRLDKKCPKRLPLSYLLALSYWMQNEVEDRPPEMLPSNYLKNATTETQWLSHLKVTLTERTGKDYQTLFSGRAIRHPITNFAYFLGQWWLNPIIDYSIPPHQVYNLLPAWKLLEQPVSALSLPEEPFVALIGPWGYAEAGINQDNEDNFPVPWALEYWRAKAGTAASPIDMPEQMPGSEIHAYMTHHFLQHRFVVPIPDAWMILVFALVGKATALAVHRTPNHRMRWLLLLLAMTGLYGLISLQLYITGAILLPWSLPVMTLWIYVLFALLEKESYG